MPHDPPRIALIGIGCRYPGGAHGPEATWAVLKSGKDPVREVPEDRWDADAWYDPDKATPGKMVTREAAFLEDCSRFDSKRFGISPREAVQMDPQQRLLLEVAWEALEDAGRAPDQLMGSRTGVYVGIGQADWARRNYNGDPRQIDAYAGTGVFSSVAAGRISYVLGLEGPAIAVHTACSSSLVAIHLAVEALRSGKVDLALAGGVNLLLAPEPSVYFSKLGALSTDGRCRAFDAGASGYGRGDGCGVIVLARADEARERGDRVRAIVRGSAVNQDGRSNGLTAPSGKAQKAVIQAALDDAGLAPHEIGLIEAHGTGTPLGDPIEAAALAAIYGPGEGTCVLRSVKTAFGHTEAAAGVAGVIAATLAVEYGEVAPQLHFTELNPRISLEGTRLSIPTEAGFLTGSRRAAVSAFGLGGTNAHLILEAPPEDDATPTLLPGRPELLVISASNPDDLERLRPQYASILRLARLEDAAYSAAHGRALQKHRLAVVAADHGQAAAMLAAGEGLRGSGTRAPPLVFAYTGQGSQWHRMAQDLYAAEAVFREKIDAVDRLLRAHREGSLVEVLYGDEPDAVHHTRWTQPAIFAVGLALTELWASWGVRPDAVMGHSVGEITAATVAGLFGLDDAVALVAERARLMGELPPGGGMAAVRAGVDVVKKAIEGLETVGIAGVNSPDQTVISGLLPEVEKALERLAADGLDTRRLNVSHAFHSPLVDPVLDAFEKVAASISFGTLRIPLYSNLTGKLAGKEIATAHYWREHVRRPVRFAHGLRAAAEDDLGVFVEIGPRPVLAGMGARTLPDSVWLPSLKKDSDGRSCMLDALAGLVVRGLRPDIDAVWPKDTQLLVELPLTPPGRERFWLEPQATPTASVASWGLAWQAAQGSAVSGRWFVDGEPDGVGAVAAGLAEQGGEVSRGLPEAPEPGDQLVWVVPEARVAAEAWEAGPEKLRALWATARASGAKLWAVTRGAVAASPTERPSPGGAMVWGLARVLSLEGPQTWGGVVDLPAGRLAPSEIGPAFGVGEDAVAVREGLRVPRLRPRAPRAGRAPRDGSWLVTGGFGALGSAVAGWLVDQGVHDLVLASRSGGEGEYRTELIRDLEARGATVRAEKVDLANRSEVVELIDRIPELVGVIHCAGEVEVGPVGEQDAAAFARALGAKVLGAESLDVATRGKDLDAFVLFSSIAATWGSAGLGGYAACNAWLDALALRRRADGLAGASLAWGPWAIDGMVSSDERRQFSRMGVGALPVESALEALGRHLHERGHRVLADVDWGRFAPVYAARRPRPLLDVVAPVAPAVRRAAQPTGLEALPRAQRQAGLTEALAGQVRAVLGLDPGTPLDPDAGLFDLGLDSLMAVELHTRLRDRLGLDLPATVAFDHPSVGALTEVAAAALGWAAGPTPVEVLGASEPAQVGPIAVVGWSARFPGAPDAEAFERLIFEGGDVVGELPPRSGVGHGGVLDGIDQFDPDWFGIGPAEARAMDPQQRMLLEVSVEALQRAGIAPGGPVKDAGVFVGIGRSAWWDRVRHPAADPDLWPWSGVGNEQSFAAGRVAYALGLRGPTIALNTACSSSLVSVHLAVQALRRGECAMALAGGVNALLSPRDQQWLEAIGALSVSGRCRTFDAAADGYVRSEGCGVLVLKRLEDAIADRDHVVGVIRGSAVGHGGASGGLTVPNGPAQAEVIHRALTDAGAAPADVGFVECHGTGTPLGDPIEVGALRTVFGERSEPLALGAIKSRIGHAETAAGVAGLIKAMLVLERGVSPASPLLERANPKLPLGWPVALPTEPRRVTGELAGVSSFGISGTNAHVVLGPAPEETGPVAKKRDAWLIPVSGHSAAALSDEVAAVGGALSHLPTGSRALVHGRTPRRFRQVAVASDAATVAEALADGWRGEAVPGRRPRVGWLFSGQGAQRVGMALALARSQPLFARALDRVVAAIDPHLDAPLREVLADERVHDTRYTQPALFAVEYALAETLQGLGCRPVAMVGHSIGEWTAAAVGGALSVEAAAKVVVARGAAMAEQPRDGAMVAVRASEEAVAAVLAEHPGAELAAVNGPEDCVISGKTAAVEAAAKALAGQGLDTRALTVSHAFHSAAMEGALAGIAQAVASVALQAPRIPIYANLDGEELGLRATDPGYWMNQARSAVRFADGLANLAASCDVLVEIGPRPVLLGLAGRQLTGGPELVPTLRGGEGSSELGEFLEAVGRLWVSGVFDDLGPVVGKGRRAVLPTTPWQHRSFWVDPPAQAAAGVPIAPIYGLSWVPARGEAQGTAVDLGEAGSAAEVAAQLVAAADEPALAIAAPGALSATGPVDRAAAVGIVAALLAERPGMAVSLGDGGPPVAGEPFARWTDGRAEAPRWTPWTDAAPAGAPEGTWMVTGARGALGRRIVRWLAEGGAHVVAVSRGEDAELAGLDRVTWVQADIGTDEGVAAALRAAPELAGAIHCAGVQRGGLVGPALLDGLGGLFAGKVGGARRLADALPDAARLVLFGSATTWLGLPGQGGYGAANAVLDGIALRRPNTVCISWGPWRAGMAAESAVDWASHGVTPLSDAEALGALGALIAGSPARVAVIRLDADRFQAHRGPMPLLSELARVVAVPTSAARDAVAALAPAARVAHLEQMVAGQLEKVLGHGIDAGLGFFEGGLDSLGAVELARRIGRDFEIALPPTFAFDHPTVGRLAEALLAKLDLGDAVEVARAGPRSRDLDEPIAVVGLAVRFAGAPDAEALWAMIRAGGHGITEVPPERWDIDEWYDPDPSVAGKMYTRYGGFVGEIDLFDPDLFGISPREATSIDPQQRLFLETAWKALDDGGAAAHADGSRTAVFVGVAERGWRRRFEGEGRPFYPDAWSGTGSEASFTSGRVAHSLGLLGPAISLNTTCSSSLVAIHLASEELRRGECDQALAGGVHLMLDPENTTYMCRLGALSPTGRCKTYDVGADGYARSEGCGVFLLKRLSDAVRDGDRIRAVIRGSAINHDGHASGLTVPSGPAQTRVIRDALERAGLEPHEIGWLQTHGAATPLGDPIELAAAAEALMAGRSGPLPVGTVKTAVGHCELAAGAAGAAAAILALEHEELPPHPVEQVNPELPLDGFELLETARPWTRGETPRRVGVSAFGAVGTNAHVIFEEGPARVVDPAPEGPLLLPVAAHSEEAFEAVIAQLEGSENPAELAQALPSRAHLAYRAAVVATEENLRAALSEARPVWAGSAPRVGFLFTGQGSQWPGMHRPLWKLAPFREALERAAAALAPHMDVPLLDLMDDEERLGLTQYTQPVLWAFEVAAAAQWEAWGVHPAAVLGHSFGEIAAATVAGSLSYEDAALLVASRGSLVGSLPLGDAMIVAHTDVDGVQAHLVDEVEITGMNDSEETALAGPGEAVDQTAASLEAAGIKVTRLRISHAFHTRRMLPVHDDFVAVANRVRWSTPGVPLISSMTGQAVTDEPGEGSYWGEHLMKPVRFADAIGSLNQLGMDAFLECGPHGILVRMGQRVVSAPGKLWLATQRRDDEDQSEALMSLGRLWERGAKVRLEALHGRGGALPPYPMQRRRFWPEGDRFSAPSWTFAERWVPGRTARPEVSGWVVLGSGAEVDALRSELGAGASVDDLADGMGVIDARFLSEADLVDHCARARALAIAAADAGARVWWLFRWATGRKPEADQAALWAWVRSAFAELPEIRGGQVDLGDVGLSELPDQLGDEVALGPGGARQPRLERVLVEGTAPELGGTWLVTGGLGSIGRKLASWLADRGVERLLLTARRALPDRSEWDAADGEIGERVAAVRALEDRGIAVKLGAFDAGDAPALAAFLEGEAVRGVVHLAGTTVPAALRGADDAEQAAVIRSKVDGARALDAWTREHPVEHFVLFGSIAAAWGSAELAAYGAANAWCAALAVRRRSEGLPGLCIAWGGWGGGGMVDAERQDRLERLGQKLMDPQKGLRLLGAAMGGAEPSLVAVQVDWERYLSLVEATGAQPRFDALRPARRAVSAAPVAAGSALAPVQEVVRSPEEQARWLRDTIHHHARVVLRLEAGRTIHEEQPLMELGFDSLMATELNNALLADGVDVALGRLLGGPSIEEIAIMAEARRRQAEPVPVAPAATEAGEGAAPAPPSPLIWTHIAAVIVGAAVASALWWAFA